MIKSAKQYEVTKRRLSEFNSAIAQFDLKAVPKNVTALGHQAAFDALVSLRDGLKAELEEFDRVRAEGLAAISFTKIADLPKVLIQTRIARGMTQTALANILDIAPQQVQRWENEDYDNAGLSYVLEIADALKIDEVLTFGKIRVAEFSVMDSAEPAVSHDLLGGQIISTYMGDSFQFWPSPLQTENLLHIVGMPSPKTARVEDIREAGKGVPVSPISPFAQPYNGSQFPTPNQATATLLPIDKYRSFEAA